MPAHGARWSSAVWRISRDPEAGRGRELTIYARTPRAAALRCGGVELRRAHPPAVDLRPQTVRDVDSCDGARGHISRLQNPQGMDEVRGAGLLIDDGEEPSLVSALGAGHVHRFADGVPGG